jgi:hypothetical protein
MKTSIVLSCLLVAAPLHAGISVSSVAFGSEDAAITGSVIEDFEDTTLLSGLSITFSGGVTPVTYPGTLPHVWDPTAASGLSGLGGPFLSNTWDGEHALTNNGHGVGITGMSPGIGNFWDFAPAMRTEFLFSTPVQLVGIGLSNFQSLSGPIGLTDHELFVNGASLGLVESVPVWTPGVHVRNGYLIITADAGDSISSIAIENTIAGDGLVFDKLALRSTWTNLGGGTVGIAGQPMLAGSGTLVGGTTATISLTNAPPNALMLAWISFSPTPFMALGGTVHAFPFANQLILNANGAGTFTAATTWPIGLPVGTKTWFQFLIEDISSIHGITLSNGLLATTP